MEISKLSPEAFQELVRSILEAELQEHGKLKTKTMLQLSAWLRTGTLPYTPWTDQEMTELRFTGFMKQVYRRASGA